MELVIIVGHEQSKSGAYNKTYNVNEFSYNEKLALDISNCLSIEHTVKYRDRYKDLPFEVNELEPDYIVSLHCNAFNTKASGTEMLYYINSVKGKNMAKVFQTNIVKALNLPDRGIKGKCLEDRGGYLLKYTNAPCIICESFFIDNDSDFEIAKARYNELIAMYVKSIYDVRNLIN